VTTTAEDDSNQQQMEITPQQDDTTTSINPGSLPITHELRYNTIVPTIPTLVEAMNPSFLSTEPHAGATVFSTTDVMTIDDYDVNTTELGATSLPYPSRTPELQDLSASSNSMEIIDISELDPPGKTPVQSPPKDSGDQNMATENTQNWLYSHEHSPNTSPRVPTTRNQYP
jgi:hypothetical protein